MTTKSLTLLFMLAVITGCASTDSQRYAALSSDLADEPEPILFLVSGEQKAAAVYSVTELVDDARSIELFNVYAVAGNEPDKDPLICGKIKSGDPRGGPPRTQPFALSGKRVMLLDEATNWGFVRTGRELTHSHRQRPFVGSWWAQCRPRTFSVLVEQYEQNQRTMKAGR
ncbi:hypothetical protein [Marinobacter orientalis]|uniref:Lipoprotein n=1 Tax=Marinobacter orientalis TaxID=1928859 RepID=A0A7Y0RBD5_9GAMM|nr:hypothetical protein [Marinobacter orientalis]NMT63112.1 hypothetical protein [Marinobacter orientalis]TGX51769.1 hypothetical protein DIT72_07070 [Marinobacter orientalis]